MARDEIEVRVTEDPSILASVWAAARDNAELTRLSAVEQVHAGGYVNYKAWDELKKQPGEAWTAVRAILEDPLATPAARANAALRLREFGDPAGEAYLLASLSDPAAETRAAALQKLWVDSGNQIDMTPPARREVLLDLIDDPDPAVARNAMLAATYRPSLHGAADRIAARLEDGTAPDPAEWGLDLLGIAETPAHVQVAVKYAFTLRAEFGHGSYEWTLRRTLSHPDSEIREPARKALQAHCLHYSAEWGEQHLARTLSAVADESAISVLEEMLATAKDPFVRASALWAILRMHPAKAVDRILTDAARADRWTYHGEMLAKFATPADAERVLAALGPVALKQSEDNLEHFIRLCTSTFGDLGRRAVQGWLPELSLRNRAVAVWGLERIELRAVLEGFAAVGLLPLPVDEVFEAARQFQEKESGVFDPTHPESVRCALYTTGILVSFDAESDERPSPHDELIMQFGKHSRGGFTPECAIQIPGEEEIDEEDEEDEEKLAADGQGPDADEFDPDGPLRVRFIHSGRVYEFDPVNFGDWYDVSAVVTAVNQAVADAGRTERFINIETGGQAVELVFAEPSRFLRVADRFAIPVKDKAARLLARKSTPRFPSWSD